MVVLGVTGVIFNFDMLNGYSCQSSQLSSLTVSLYYTTFGFTLRIVFDYRDIAAVKCTFNKPLVVAIHIFETILAKSSVHFKVIIIKSYKRDRPTNANLWCDIKTNYSGFTN